MKIFIDSASLSEIQEAYSYGVIDGVTTNPSLIKKAVQELNSKGRSIDMPTYIKKILNVAKGTPVSLEVTETSFEGMVQQGKKIFKMFNPVARNVYVKVPVNPSFDAEPSMDGLKAIRALSKARIPVNCTLIFTPEQALLAAKAGAKIVSPFAGRIDDLLRDNNSIKYGKADYFPPDGIKKDDKVMSDNGIVSGIDLIRQTVQILNNYGYKTEVIAASIRNARQTRDVALTGAHIATLPFATIKDLLVHAKTQEGMQKFTDDIVPDYALLLK